MTTTNLSVGIKTEKVALGLDDLKRRLQSQRFKVGLELDTSSFKSDLDRVLKDSVLSAAKTFSSSIAAELHIALNRSAYTIKLDTNDLALQFKEAAGKAGIGGAMSAGIPQGAGPNLANLIQALGDMTHKLDGLSGAGGQPGDPTTKGPRRYTRSMRARAADGSSVGYSERISAEAGASGLASAREQAAAAAAQQMRDDVGLEVWRRQQDARLRISQEHDAAVAKFRAEQARTQQALDDAGLERWRRQQDERLRISQEHEAVVTRFKKEQEDKRLSDARAAETQLQNELRTVQRFAQESARTSGLGTNGQKAAGYSAVLNAAGGTGLSPQALSALNGRSAQDVAGGFLNLPGGHIQSLVRGLNDLDPAVARNRAHLVSWRDTVNEVHSAARGLAGSLGQIWVTWGSTVPLVAMGMLGTTLKDVFTSGKDVERQLAAVSALSDGASVNLGKFTAALGGLDTPTAAAQGLRALAQNGLSVNQALVALPGVMSLAAAGEMKIADAALSATGVLAAFNLQVTDLSHVSDVFAKSAAISNTSVTGMTEAMKQASTVSDMYGVSLEQTGAALATLAKRNILGSAAGTAYRNFVDELAAPTKKAQEAFKALNIEVFDKGTGKMKDFDTILKSLHDRMITLNEASSSRFMSTLFNERGRKAANAFILSDYDTYLANKSTLLSDKTKGFSEDYASALRQTASGKLDMLINDFHAGSVKAFADTSDSVKALIDNMRVLVNSMDFKDTISGLASGVSSLTTGLFEHGKAIAAVALGYTGLKIVIGGLVGINDMLGAWERGGGAAGWLKSLTTSMGAATLGWVALGVAVAAVAAGYAAYKLVVAATRTEIDLMTDSERAYHAATKAGEIDNEKRLNQLRTENELLEAKNKLRDKNPGMSNSEVDQELNKNERASKLKSLQDDVNSLHWRSWQARQAADDMPGSRNLDLEARRQETLFADAKTRLSNYEKLEQAQKENERRRTSESRSGTITNLNAQIQAVNSFRQKEVVAKLVRADLIRDSVSDEEFNQIVEAAKQQIQKNKENLTLPDHRGAGQAEKDMMSLLNYRKKLVDADIRLEDEKFAAIERANKASLKNREVTEYGFAYLQERATASHLDKVRALISGEMNYLEKLVKDKTGKTTDELDDLLRKGVAEGREPERVVEKLAGSKIKPSDLLRILDEINSFKTGEDATRSRSLSELSSTQEGARGKSLADDERRRAALFRLTNPPNNGAKLYHEYAGEIASVTAEMARNAAQMTSIQDLIKNQAADATQDNIEAQKKSLDDLDENQKKLEKFRGTLSDALTKYSHQQYLIAGDQHDYRTSARGGIDKMWVDYSRAAEDNARTVEAVMNGAFGSMEQGIAKFTQTGKHQFNDFTKSVLRDAATLLQNAVVKKLLSIGLDAMFGGWKDSGSMSDATNGGGYWEHANGGIMTPWGDTKLRQYAAGGIANSPQFSIFGEGTTPEAYVPLADGRTIPVTVSGGSGGGNMQSHVTVNIASNGSAQVESSSSSAQAAEMGRRIDDAVRSVLMRERRPGGILA